MSREDPWKPDDYEPADITAIQQVLQGTASEEMQKRAMAFIIETLCGTYQPSYRTGTEGRRDTDYAEGKRFVGLQIVKLQHLIASKLRRK